MIVILARALGLLILLTVGACTDDARAVSGRIVSERGGEPTAGTVFLNYSIEGGETGQLSVDVGSPC